MSKTKQFDYLKDLKSRASVIATNKGYSLIYQLLQSCDIHHRYIGSYNDNKYNNRPVVFPALIEDSKIIYQLNKSSEYVFIDVLLADFRNNPGNLETIGYFSWQLPDMQEVFKLYECLQFAAWETQDYLFDNFEALNK